MVKAMFGLSVHLSMPTCVHWADDWLESDAPIVFDVGAGPDTALGAVCAIVVPEVKSRPITTATSAVKRLMDFGDRCIRRDSAYKQMNIGRLRWQRRRRRQPRLEPRSHPEYRPMHRHVELVKGKPAALRVVDVKRPVAEHGAPCDSS